MYREWRVLFFVVDHIIIRNIDKQFQMTNASLLTLPTELLFHILNHLDACFIIFSVRPVCQRLYAISAIYDQYELDLDSIPESYLGRISRIVQPENITSLILNSRSDRSTQVKLVFSRFEISRMTRLRSITLGKLSQWIDYELLNQLVISDLVSLNIDTHGIYANRALAFLSKVMTQPTLCKLNLMESDYRIEEMSWLNSFSIVHLTLKSCSLKEYNTILQRLPRLRTIVMAQLIMQRSNELITSYSASTQYTQLMSLVIGNSSLSMNDFELVLSLTPSLVRLKLISYRVKLDSILDGSDWERLIQIKLPDLKTFQFFFSYNLQKGDDAKDLDLLVDRFRTPFWLHDKKWIITCDYVLQKKCIYFYTTPRCTKDVKQQLQSTNTFQPSSLKIRFNAALIDRDFHPVVHLMYATDDITESTVCTKIFSSEQSLVVIGMWDDR